MEFDSLVDVLFLIYNRTIHITGLYHPLKSEIMVKKLLVTIILVALISGITGCISNLEPGSAPTPTPSPVPSPTPDKPISITKDELEKDYQQHFKQGNIYLEQEQWDKAIAEFYEVIDCNPKFEEEAAARVGRGIANAWAGNFKQAENDLKMSYDSFGSADAYIAFGIAMTAQHSGSFDEAESLFSTAISLDPNNPDAYTGRALWYLQEAYIWGIGYETSGAANLRWAISDFEKAIELDSRDIQGRIERFNFQDEMAFLPNYIKANKQYGALLVDVSGYRYYDDALEVFARVLEVAPKDVEALIGRGNAYMGLQQYDLALYDFVKASELEPDYPNTYAGATSVDQLPFIQGNSYLKQKGESYGMRWNEAIAAYTKAIEINPEFAEAYANRALARFRQMEYMRGHSGFEYGGVIKDCEKAFQLNPSLRLNKELARAYQYWGDYDIDTSRIPSEGSEDRRKAEDKAITAYSRAIMIDPDYADYYIRRGSLYARLAEHYLDLGQLSRQTDIYTIAIADLTRAIELEPSAYAYRTRGNIFTGMATDYVKAVVDYTRALELGIEYEWNVYSNRASIYAKLGKKDKAIAD